MNWIGAIYRSLQCVLKDLVPIFSLKMIFDQKVEAGGLPSSPSPLSQSQKGAFEGTPVPARYDSQVSVVQVWPFV